MNNMWTVYNIVWCVEDNKEGLSAEELGLPDEVEVPKDILCENIAEDICDYLSEKYGYCVEVFDVKGMEQCRWCEELVYPTEGKYELNLSFLCNDCIKEFENHNYYCAEAFENRDKKLIFKE